MTNKEIDEPLHFFVELNFKIYPSYKKQKSHIIMFSNSLPLTQYLPLISYQDGGSI